MEGARLVARLVEHAKYSDETKLHVPNVKLTMQPTYAITAEPTRHVVRDAIGDAAVERTVEIAVEPLEPQGPPEADTSS